MTETKAAIRDWRLKTSRRIQTCTFCGNSIEPGALFYRDIVSGHLNAHRGCLKPEPDR
jgi:hypothetical protein